MGCGSTKNTAEPTTGKKDAPKPAGPATVAKSEEKKTTPPPAKVEQKKEEKKEPPKEAPKGAPVDAHKEEHKGDKDKDHDKDKAAHDAKEVPKAPAAGAAPPAKKEDKPIEEHGAKPAMPVPAAAPAKEEKKPEPAKEAAKPEEKKVEVKKEEPKADAAKKLADLGYKMMQLPDEEENEPVQTTKNLNFMGAGNVLANAAENIIKPQDGAKPAAPVASPAAPVTDADHAKVSGK